MPPSSSTIRKTIRTHLDRHPEERDALAGLPAVWEQPADVTARTMLPGHVTRSAVVVDRRHRAAQGLVLAPGGHVEPEDRTLLDAALRELSEEAGPGRRGRGGNDDRRPATTWSGTARADGGRRAPWDRHGRGTAGLGPGRDGRGGRGSGAGRATDGDG
ncbi:NUDIX domain-containing protein [Streptomyces sp. NPDC012438]|uniref:NUDIX domain-containing protein n=1 Tax=Streptomyces sp. NPDC012438 TaxID=3364833 RepID=UPI0036ECD217